jgi:hypothetical protein
MVVGMTIQVRVLGNSRLTDLTGTGMIFYPQAGTVPDPSKDEHMHMYFSPPTVNPKLSYVSVFSLAQ